jgi:uncharacterized protein YjbJ (UPF0337 family)
MELAGKVQVGLGMLAGNPLQQDKGVKLRNVGRLQVFLGDLKEFEELEIRDREFGEHWDAWVSFRG